MEGKLKDDIISFDVKNKAFARCSSQLELSVHLTKSTVLHKLHKLHNFFFLFSLVRPRASKLCGIIIYIALCGFAFVISSSA